MNFRPKLIKKTYVQVGAHFERKLQNFEIILNVSSRGCLPRPLKVPSFVHSVPQPLSIFTLIVKSEVYRVKSMSDHNLGLRFV